MNQCFISIGTIGILICLFQVNIMGQQTLCYPLEENLEPVGTVMNAPPLSILSNAQGQNGNFVNMETPATFCPQGGMMTAFHFEDNVGLAFDNNTADLIDCEYSVEFMVNFEELPFANPFLGSRWIWVLGTYNDDDGLFIARQLFSDNLFLEFWDSATLLKSVPFNDFNTTDWFYLTITRDCSGKVKVYINCEFFTDFMDARNVLRLHPSTGNRMIFFQDDPSILVGDAAPGNVRNIKISNFIKDEQLVSEQCDCLCESLLSDCSIETTRDSFTCDPFLVGSVMDTIPSSASCACQCDSVITTNYILLSPEECESNCEQVLVSDTLLCRGTFFKSAFINRDTIICDTLVDTLNCVTVDCMAIQLLPNAFTPLDTAICPGESVTIGNVTFNTAGSHEMVLPAANGCDSVITLDLSILEGETIIVDTLLCPGEVLGEVVIQKDTSFCRTITGNLDCERTVCYNAQLYVSTSTLLKESICPGESLPFGDTLLTTPGLYSRLFLDQNGCDSLVELQLDTFVIPTEIIDTALCFGAFLAGATIFRDTLICVRVPDNQTCYVNRCYQVKADTAYLLQREEYFCAGTAFILGDSVYDTPGTYLHALQTTNGCDSFIVLKLEEWASPALGISGMTTFCPGDSALLDAGPEFIEYEWLPTGATTQVIRPTAAGQYSVQATDEFGCRQEQMVAVIEASEVSVAIELEQTESCPGSGDAVLNVLPSGGSPPFVYQWSDGATISQRTDLSAGVYTITVVDQMGCMGFDSITLAPIEGFEIDIDITHPECLEDGTGQIVVEASGDNGPYLYQLNDGLLTANAVFTGLTTGWYTILVEDINGCQQLLEVQLVTPNLPELEIYPAHVVMDRGDSINLVASYSGSAVMVDLQWSPGQFLSCDTCSSVFAYPSDNTVFQLTGTTDLGCRVQTTATVEVVSNPTMNSTNFFAPNIFSPNNDGVNDVFQVFPAKSVEAVVNFQIWDRWGALVFQKDELLPGSLETAWDGKRNGELLPLGVYLWKAELITVDGAQETAVGDILLIR